MFTEDCIYLVGIITSSQTLNEYIVTLLNGFFNVENLSIHFLCIIGITIKSRD